MVQLMTFAGDGNISISECYNDGQVVINFNKQNTVGSVSFDERHLRELRKWLTIQIRTQSSVNKKKNNAATKK